ncbi:MAG: class I SAM-dependent rRNA methyltransferase [Firmicutes bacterium]|nr:class I SAM-dependent rRNA methyltransferase [Bacillota bacterium]
MAIVHLTRGWHRAQDGHPWVFAGEIETIGGDFAPGDLVTVVDHRGRFVGRGFINPASLIRVRLLTHRDEQVDDDFWLARLRAAWELRRSFWVESAFRVVFAESDGLPGLVVDRFGPWLVMQTLALGVEVRRDFLVEALRSLTGCTGVFLRNDAPVRELEGLPQERGPAPGTPPDLPTRVEVTEGDVRLWVDVAEGQKTGHFLDQRLNRAAAARLAPGARVLDAFSYTGGFAIHAARAGAREVLAIEASAWAVGLARENAELNGVADRCRFQEGNAFDLLRTLDQERERFDLAILDPPAFARSREALEGALRGYKEINLRALHLLNPGGYLVTSSCSSHLDPDTFLGVVAGAARDAGRRVLVLEARGQPPDHPILLGYPESRYLKCLICRT